MALGNDTCDMPSPLQANASEPIVGNLSFRQLNMIISGSCTAFVFVAIFLLMFRHATHYSKPNEQSKIMKVCFMLPVFSLLSFLGIVWPNSYIYLDPWRAYWEGIALGSFFLLICEFVSPSANFRDVFFAALELPAARKAREKGKAVKNVDGLEWYRRKWIAVFQFVVIALGLAIATDITQAIDKYCMTSESIQYAHIWLEIIGDISISVAVLAVLRVYQALGKDLQHHRPLPKLLAFKLLVGLTFSISILFTILRSTNVLTESPHYTYADVNFGFETMTTCVLIVPFSIFFHWAYSVSPYDITKPRMLPLSEIPPQYQAPLPYGQRTDGGRNSPDEHHEDTPFNDTRYLGSHSEGSYYQGGFLGWKAWLGVLDPREILRAIMFAFTMRRQAEKMGREVVGVQGQGKGYHQGGYSGV